MEATTEQRPKRTNWRWRLRSWIDQYADITPQTLEEAERALIMRTLRETEGNVTKTAVRLRVDRRTLYRRLWQYADEQAAADQTAAS